MKSVSEILENEGFDEWAMIVVKHRDWSPIMKEMNMPEVWRIIEVVSHEISIP